jgi:dTDP-4-amino-4,6-dideoxygalactose transaminase
MVKIPFSPPDIGIHEKNALLRVFDSNWISQGPETSKFEQEISDYIGCKHTIVVNNGTSALVSALLAHGISKGDEVIVPSFTFMATINSIIAVGAKPVLVDVDLKTWNLSVELAEEKISEKTRAIMPVDVAGMPIDIEKFRKFAKEHNLVLIEDAAEAIGAEFKQKKIGSFNHTTIFSFHMAKLITTIEGGCILTNDPVIAENCRQIRNHGMHGKYNYVTFGLNFRSTDLQSAIGRVQLTKLNRYIKKRNEIVSTYKDILSDLVVYQEIPDYVSTHPYMIFGVLVKKHRRNKINDKLNKLGIATRMWPPIYTSPYHNQIFNEKFTNADDIALRLINLPIGNGSSISDVQYVGNALKKIIKEEL